MVGTWVYDQKASKCEITGNLPGQEDSDAWQEVTFKADGSFVVKVEGEEDYTGKYSVKGSDLTLTIIDEEYGTITMKKGASIADIYGGDGEEESALKVILKDQTVSVKGNVLTLYQEIEMAMDLSDLGMGKVSGTTKLTSVYNRK